MNIKIVEYKFDNTLYDLFPEFNEGFTYTYEDVVEENITTRTIYSDSLPTMVKFGGNVTAYNLNPNKFDSLLNILYVNTSNIDDMSYMFGRCKSLQTVYSSDWGTSNVTNMNSIFCDCRKLTSLDASNFDTNTVTDMGSMFYNCQALTSVGDISNWNTSKVTTMYGMFQGCSSLTSLDVSNFDTSKVTTMNTMFWGCRKLTSLDVSNWDTNTVTDMYGLFQGCQSLTSLNASNWNTGNVTNMYMMFYYCKSLTSLDLTNFDTSKVTNMSDMLNFCPLLNSILMSNSDHNSVNKIINQLPTRTEDNKGTLYIGGVDDISKVDLTTAESKYWNVENKYLIAEYKFDNTLYDLFPEFNEGFTYTYEDVVEEGVTIRTIYSGDLPTLIRFGHHEGEVSNRELSLLEVININTSCITTMNTMFCVCKNVTRIKLGNTKSVNDMYAAFYHCDKLVEVIADTWNTSNVTDMSYMLSYCGSLTTLDVSEWDTSKVTNMDSLFYECSKLTSIDVSKWNTENVENMRQLFDFCKLLNSLDVSKWNTSKATSMRYMFGYCESLTELDVSNFDTGQVTDMLCTFTNCKLLTKIDVDNWDMRNVLDISSMFSKCTSLTELNVNNWDVSNIKNMNHVFTGLLLENIDISNWRPISAIEIDGMFWDCSNLKEIDLTNFTPSDEATSLALMFSNTGITSLDSILGLSKLINYMKPTEVYNMFNDCKALTSVDISDWDTRNFSSLQNMFAGCSSLSSVKLNINTSNITNLFAMFYDCSSLTTLNLSNFNTSKVNNIRMMFSLCTSLTTLNISNWDLNAVTNILYLFYDCNNLNAITMNNSDYNSVNKVIAQLPTRTEDNKGTLYIGEVDDINQVDTEAAESKNWVVENKYLIAKYTANASGVVPTFNSGYVYDVIETVNEGIYTVELYAENDFSSCSFRDKLNLLTVDYLRVTNKVTNMQSMFNGCNNLTSIDASNWDVSEVTTMKSMFFGCNLLAQLDVRNWNTGKVTSMRTMFIYCNNLTSLDVSKWDTSNVTDMDSMFYSCYNLTSLDVSNFDTSNVTKMNHAFNCCKSLTQLDLSKWDTSKVTTISMMFNYCSNLTQLDLSNFDTSKVTSMSRSFSLLPNLQKLNISNWVIIDSCNVSNIFAFEGASEDDLCKNLNEVIMCNSDYNSVNKIIAQIPVRTEDNKGTLDITGVDDIAQVNIADAKAKNWNVKSNVVAKYTFNNTLYDLIPEFNEGFTNYTYEDIVDGEVTTRTIYSIDDSLPTMIKFGAPVFQATDSSSSLLSVDYINFTNIDNMFGMFKYCVNVTEINTSNWDTSKVTTMTQAFGNCQSLTTLDVSNFDTSNVITMGNMFDGCRALTSIDVSNWDTSNVTDMRSLFSYCTSLTSIDISNLDTSKAVNMNRLFEGDTALTSIDLSSLDVSSNKTFYFLFYGCTSLTYVNLTNWNTQNLTDMGSMFSGCTNLTRIDGIENLNTSNVTDMYATFLQCKKLTSLDLSNWDTSNVTKMTYIFRECSSLTSLDLNNWDVGNVTVAEQMFTSCTGLTSLKINKWSMEKVNSLAYMFYGCTGLTSLDVSNLVTSNVTDVKDMFEKCYNLTSVDVSNWDTSNVTNMGLMFSNCTSLTSLDASNWDTSNVTNMQAMFNNCKSLTSLNVSNWDTSNATDMSWMFYGCKFTSLDLSGWNTSNVTTMNSMFSSCTSLTSLDLNNWDVGKVSTMYGMFQGCTALSSIKMDNLNTDSLTNIQQMFYNCNFTSLDLSGWNTTNITNTAYLVESCKLMTTLNLSNWDMNKVTKIVDMFNDTGNLNNIIMHDSDSGSVNKIIEQLPTRTEDNPGTLDMTRGISGMSQLNIDAAEAKYWTVALPKIVEYKFNSTIDTLPSFNEGLVYEYNDIDNGDGTITRTIIAETLPTYMVFYDCTGLLEILYLNIDGLTSGNWMFDGCVNLTSINTSNMNTSRLTDMSYMFFNCNKLTQLDVSNWDTSNVTTMYRMFCNCKSLTSIDVSNFDTSNVTNMQAMFAFCDKLTTLGDLSNWDTGNVIDMSQMFNSTKKLTSLDVSNFDTSKVKDMSFMFQNCRAPELDVSNFDTSNVTNISGIFNGCINVSQLDVSKWDTSNVTNMSAGVFGSCRKVTELDLSNWNTGKVTVMNSVFSGCSELTTIGNVSKWDVSNVTDIRFLFDGCTKLTSLNLSGWNTSKVTNMNSVFNNCSSIEKLNLSNWTLTDDGAVVTNMFAGCTNLRELNISNLCKTIKPELLSLEANTAIRELNLFNWSNGNIEHLLINNQLPGNAATYSLRARAVGDDERVVYSRYVSNENKNVLNELGWVVVVPKLVDTVGVKKIAKAVKDIAKAELDVEVLRATNAEADLQAQIDEIEINCDNKASKEELQEVEAMFGGKSFRYVLQEEYDNLSEEEKNDKSKTYFITDAVDLSHSHENKEFLDGLNQEVLDDKASKEELQEVETLLNNKSDIIEFNAGERINKDFAGNINSNLDSQNVDVYGKINLVVDNDYIVYISIDITDNEGNVTTLNDKRIVSAETYNAEGSVLLNILDGKIMIIDNSIVNSKGQCIYYKNYLAIIYNELIQAYGNNIVVKKLDIFETDYRQINSELFSSGDYHLLTNAEKQTIGNVLTKDNTENYTPTEKYNPATKSYVDNSILNGRPLYDVSDVVEPIEYDCSDVLPITLSEGINYINIPNHLNITQGVEYNLECTKSDSSLFGIMVISSAIATYDENKDCLVLDFGGNTIIYVGVYYNEADGTFIKNENNHVYSDAPLAGYNRIKKIELTASDATPVCDEFLKVFKFVTEEEKAKWNNKANKEDMYYDTRELQEINITFDGDATGKEVVGFYFSSSGSLSANGLVKITDEIYDNIQIVETITATSPTSIMYYYCEKDEIIVTDDYILAGTGYRYVVSVKNDGTYELNSGIKPVTLTRGTYIYYSNTNSLKYMSDVKLIINTNNGELSVIDEKYLINSPGRYQEGKVKTINTDEGIEKVVCGKCSEIFNSEFNIASGESSHAEGYNTKAIGVMSHAEGNGTGAYGNYSHSEGTATAAKGSGSHAEGSATQAIGAQSHAEGYRTIASADYQHVQGQYNIEDTENKYAHIVGNGAYNKPSNAHTLDWNGNAWFQGNVSVDGTPTNDNDLVTKKYVDESIVQALSGLSITKVTQAEYDALTIKDPNTLYIITQ